MRRLFAGILACTEHTFGLSPLGANDAAACSFSNAFDCGQVPQKTVRLVCRPLPAPAKRIHLTRPGKRSNLAMP